MGGPICSKVFEKLVLDTEFMIERNLLSSTQSGFKPKDSWVNQLIAIIRIIFSAFDVYPSLEVLGVLLDLSKAFDRVLDKDVTKEEVKHELSKMEINKSPGNDDLTKELYGITLKFLFFYNLKSLFWKKKLSTYQKQAVIKLIEK